MATVRTKTRPPEYERHIVQNRSERGGARVRGIMAHTTESAEVPGGDADLMSVFNWFNNPASQASSHVGIDGEGNSHLWVPSSQKAWTMGHREINAETLNIEFIGRAAQPAADWEEKQIKVGAKWAAYWILNLRSCDIAEHVKRLVMVPGPSIMTAGLGRHSDLTNVGVGTHTDPGPNFPMSTWMRQTQYYIDNGWTVKT